MRAPWKRAAALALATCGISFLPLINGCKTDVDRADEAIRADVDSATADLANGRSNDATKALQSIAGAKGGSPEAQVEYNSLLAQSEVDAADTLIRRLAQQEAQISGILNRMQMVGWQVVTNNANVTSYQNLNPTQASQAYQQAIAAAQQGEGGGWVKGNPPIPAMSDVKQQTEKLQKQLDDLNHQKADQTQKRDQALQSAGKFDQQADSTRGSDSVGFFTQAANQRKEAADAETRVHDLDLQIQLVQQQLSVAKGQEQGIQGAVDTTQAQAQQLQTSWQNIQKQIEAARDYNKSLLSGAGGAAPSGGGATTEPAAGESASLSSLASELEQATKAAQDLRSQALSLLNSAMSHYTTAQDIATKRNADLNKMVRDPNSAKLPEKHAWQDLINLNQPAGFQLGQAGVLGRLARVYVDQYLEMAQRNALARLLDPALKQVGGDVPQALASVGSAGAPSAKVREQVDKLEGDMNKSDFGDFAGAQTTLQQLATDNGSAADQQAIAGALADLSYFWADTLLNNVLQGSPAGDLGQLAVNMAHAQRVINYYGWSQFAELTGKSQEQRGRLATAQSEYKALDDAKATYLLPAVLPPGLLPEAATTQPTTQPGAEGATTQPGAEGATTQPAGASAPVNDTPEQAEVRTAALSFNDAIRAADFQKARSLSTGPDEELVTLLAFMKTYNQFWDAANQKFGADAKRVIPALNDMAESLRTEPITINGETATFVDPQKPEDPDPTTMRRENGAWKMDLTPRDPAAASARRQRMEQVGIGLGQITAAIQEGKLQTAEQVRDLLKGSGGTTKPAAAEATTQPAH